MPEINNELLVTLQFFVENADYLTRLSESLRSITNIQDDRIVENIEFNVEGLDRALENLRTGGDLSDETASKIRDAEKAFIQYAQTLDLVKKKLASVSQRADDLRTLRDLSQSFFIDPKTKRVTSNLDLPEAEAYTDIAGRAFNRGGVDSDIISKLESGNLEEAFRLMNRELSQLDTTYDSYNAKLTETALKAKQAEGVILDLAGASDKSTKEQSEAAVAAAKLSQEQKKIVTEAQEYTGAIASQASSTNKAAASISEYVGHLQNIVNAIESLPQRLEAATSQTTEAVEQLVNRMDKLSASLDKVARSTNAYVTQLKVLSRQQREATTVITGFASSAEDSMKDLGDTTAVYGRHAESARRSTIGFITGAAGATATGRQFNQVMGQTGQVVTSAARGTIGFGRGLDEVRAEGKKAADVIEDVGKKTKGTAKDGEEGAKSMSNFTSAFRVLLKDRRQFGKVLEFAVGRLGIYAAAASIVYGVAAAIRTAITEAVKFEETLSQIQGVLPSRNEFAADIISDAAIRNASRFGVSISEAAEAAKTFAQTGRSATQIAKDLEAAFLAVRGANLNVEQAKDLIIAIENITNGELEALQVLDRISRVESRRAITAQDLAVGFQRIGPLVRQLKGDMAGLVDEYDVASGALTTIVERTRVTGNNAATSLRFILSRLGRPDVVNQLQQLSGVGLGREGGRQLRPFVEILEDLSFAYQKLQREGQSAQAFQLLATLGGARQLQATSTLLENFTGTTLETATIAATAFNDASERTDIALDNIANSARKAGTAWTSFSSSLIEAKAVSESVQVIFGILSGAGNSLAAVFRTYNEIETDFVELVTGRSRFAFRPFDIGGATEEQLARFTAFATSARANGQSVSSFTENLNQLSRQVADSASQRFGLPFSDIVEQLKSGEAEDSFRGLREFLGETFADALENSTNALDEYRQQLNETQDPAEQAELQTKRITTAFNLLGSAIYANSAVIELNNDKIVESTKSVFEQLITSYNTTFQQVRGDRRGLFETILGRGYLKTEVGTFKEFERFSQSIRNRSAIVNINDELTTFDDILYESSETAKLWKSALEEAWEDPGDLPATQRFLRAQDIFTESVLASENYGIIVENLTDEIARVLELGDGITATTIQSERFGQTAANNLNILFSAVVANMQKTRTLTSQQIQDIRQVVDAFGSALAAQDAMIVSGQDSFARLNQELLNIFIQFTSATKAAQQLGQIYGELGITFDETNAKFEASKTFLEGLVQLPTKLTGEAAQLFNQLQEATKKQGSGTSLDQLGQQLALSLEQTGELSDVQGVVNRNAEELRATYESLSLQINSLNSLDLRTIFGGSSEGRQLLQDFKLFTQLQGQDPVQDVITMAALIERTKQLVAVNYELINARERSRILLEAESQEAIRAAQFAASSLERSDNSALSLERQRLEILGRAVALTTSRGEAIVFEADALRKVAEEELRISRQRADSDLNIADAEYRKTVAEIERRQAEEGLGTKEAENELLQARLQLTSEQTKIEDEQLLILRERLAQLREEIQTLATTSILESYEKLNAQINSNIQAASSGIRTILRDYDSLKRDSVKTVLSPIANTFLDRIAENFTSSLFDATSDSFFGKIAEAYGATPEQRLREQLNTSFTRGAQIMGAEFDEFIANLATVLGVSAPNSSSTVGGGSSLTTATGADKSRNKILAEQFALLASTQIGTALGANLGGNQANANFGASLGGVAGSFLPLALNGFAVGGPLGAIVGGLVGGLFGRDDQEKRHEEQLQALDKIEYNTGRSVSELELQRQFLEVARGAVNIPTGFNVPGFLPGGGVGGTQNNDIIIQISISNASNGEEVVQTIRRDLGPALTEELRKIGL